ncbi:DUF4440 domain-containing protein [Trichostrongylus colubriformis]|uniref:DUF4440 domain-containing protein n=1 Tax=Trichostrongylus colubriformis TaxID=6319 RepID=A0AAN8FRH3_TRICO
MQPKDVEATLKPLYTKWEEYAKIGNCEEVASLYHSQAVIVEKGVKATFGKEEIVKLLKEFWDKIGPHKLETSNESYQGTDDYLIVHCNYVVHPEKGAEDVKGKMAHIWKKEEGNWKIYHDEFEYS